MPLTSACSDLLPQWPGITKVPEGCGLPSGPAAMQSIRRMPLWSVMSGDAVDEDYGHGPLLLCTKMER